MFRPQRTSRTNTSEPGCSFCHPDGEGFVLVLTEAKDAGLPAVSFNCPEGPADILKDGFLVESENIEAFAERIVYLAKNEELRKRFGAAAKEDIKCLSAEIVFKMWDNLFKKI